MRASPRSDFPPPTWPQQLTLHSDRGAQMTSTSLAELLEDLAVTRSLSRPRVSNDNPYSEAGFKTVKYRHDYPDRFHSLEEVRSWMAPFVDWYNREHYHSGVGYQHPATLHGGEALETRAGASGDPGCRLQRLARAVPQRTAAGRQTPEGGVDQQTRHCNNPLTLTGMERLTASAFSIQRDIGRYLLSACSDDTRHA